jgi:hypothetical protein
MPKEKPQNTDSSIDTIPTGTKQQRQVEKEKQEKKRQEATREGIERIEEDEREGTKKAEELIESIILMIPSPLTRKQVKEKQKQDRSERRKRVLEKVLAWISGETPKEEKRMLLKTSTINNLIKLDKIEVPIDRVLWALHNYPDREEQILQPRYYERFKKCWGGFKHLTARIFKTSEKMSIITNKDFVIR